MTRVEIATLEHASRSVMAAPHEAHDDRLARLMTATVPAFGILAACALMLSAVLA